MNSVDVMPLKVYHYIGQTSAVNTGKIPAIGPDFVPLVTDGLITPQKHFVKGVIAWLKVIFTFILTVAVCAKSAKD